MATLIRTAAQILADITPAPRRPYGTTGSPDRLRAYAAAGLTDQEIAAHVGASREGVRRARYRHGIPPGRTVRGRHTAAPDPDARGGGR